MQKKEWLRIGLCAALAVAGVSVCAGLILRNLSLFLQFEPQFSAIFAQIQDAPLRMPIVLLAAVVLSFGWVGWLGQQRKRRGLAVFCGIALWLLSVIAVVLLTRVNGIRFCDVLFSLLDVMRKGGL